MLHCHLAAEVTITPQSPKEIGHPILCGHMQNSGIWTNGRAKGGELGLGQHNIFVMC